MATQQLDERPPMADACPPPELAERRAAKADDWTAVAVAISVLVASIVLALSIASHDRDPGDGSPAAPPAGAIAP
jgi:hypothetical protein